MSVCRLCSKAYSETDFSKNQVLSALQEQVLPDTKFSVLDNLEICEECLKKINNLLECTAIIREELQKFKDAEIDLGRTCSTCDLNETHKICCICFKMISNGLGTSDVRSRNEKLVNMLNICNIPVNWRIFDCPATCLECLESMRLLYTIKTEVVEEETTSELNSYTNATHSDVANCSDGLSDCYSPSRKKMKTCSELDQSASNHLTEEVFVKEEHLDCSEIEEKYCPDDSKDTVPEVKYIPEPAFLIDADNDFSNMFDAKEKDSIKSQPNVTNSEKSSEQQGYRLGCRAVKKKFDPETWSTEKDIKLLNLYCDLTKNQTLFCTGYPQKLQEEWVKMYPDDELLGINGKNLVIRARNIIKTHGLPIETLLEKLQNKLIPIVPISEDHIYSKSSLIKKKQGQSLGKHNHDLLKLYLEVTHNETRFEEGYLHELQRRWLSLHPESIMSGERLASFAHHVITNKMVSSDVLTEMRRELILGNGDLNKLVPTADLPPKELMDQLYRRVKTNVTEEIKEKYVMLVKLYLTLTDNETFKKYNASTLNILGELWADFYPNERLKGFYLYKLARYILHEGVLPSKQVKLIRKSVVKRLVAMAKYTSVTERHDPNMDLVGERDYIALVEKYWQFSRNQNFNKMFLCWWSCYYPENKKFVDPVRLVKSILKANVIPSEALAQIRRRVQEKLDNSQSAESTSHKSASQSANLPEHTVSAIDLPSRRQPETNLNVSCVKQEGEEVVIVEADLVSVPEIESAQVNMNPTPREKKEYYALAKAYLEYSKNETDFGESFLVHLRKWWSRRYPGEQMAGWDVSNRARQILGKNLVSEDYLTLIRRRVNANIKRNSFSNALGGPSPSYSVVPNVENSKSKSENPQSRPLVLNSYLFKETKEDEVAPAWLTLMKERQKGNNGKNK